MSLAKSTFLHINRRSNLKRSYACCAQVYMCVCVWERERERERGERKCVREPCMCKPIICFEPINRFSPNVYE